MKTAGMLRSDGTLGLDPVYEIDGWRTYVVYPVPRAVVDSYELAMGMRMQARRINKGAYIEYRDVYKDIPAQWMW